MNVKKISHDIPDEHRDPFNSCESMCVVGVMEGVSYESTEHVRTTRQRNAVK